MTQLDRLPPEKVVGLTITREAARAMAADIDPATREVVEGMLADMVLEPVQARQPANIASANNRTCPDAHSLCC